MPTKKQAREGRPKTSANGTFAKESRPDFTVTAGQFGEVVGAHPTSVARWVKDGLPHRRDGRVTWIDLRVGVPWVLRSLRKELDDVRNATDPESAKRDKLVAEARLKELDLAEREGKLVSADDAEAAWTQAGAALRESVMDVAALAVQSGLIDPGREQKLEALLRDALVVASRKVQAAAPAVDDAAPPPAEESAVDAEGEA